MPRRPALPAASEKDIHWGIVRALKNMRFAVYSTAQARPSKVAAGLPDLIIFGTECHVFAEVKRPGGRQSSAQRAFQGNVEAAGLEYEVWFSVQDAVRWAENHLRRQRARARGPGAAAGGNQGEGGHERAH